MPILALHGFTGRGSDFAPLAELCGGTWHCPDLPGHGPAPQLDCSPEATLDFLDTQFSTFNLQASTPHVLLGYSMGARAALLHATRNPELWDALILISANPGIEDEAVHNERRTQDAALADRIERDGLEAFLEYWQNTPLIRSQQNIRPQWLAAMREARLQHQPTALANSLRQFGQGSCPNLWPKLDQLKMPLCLITGALDNKYTQIAERLHQLPKLATEHTVIEDASHMPHLEKAEASAAVIRRFLES